MPTSIPILRLAKRIGCILACTYLSACVGTTGYRFPVQSEMTRDVFHDKNGHFVYLNNPNGIETAAGFIPVKEAVELRLDKFYPIGSSITEAAGDLNDQGFSCERVLSPAAIHCLVDVRMMAFSSSFPLTKKCLSVRGRNIAIILQGSAEVEKIEVRTTGIPLSCEDM